MGRPAARAYHPRIDGFQIPIVGAKSSGKTSSVCALSGGLKGGCWAVYNWGCLARSNSSPMRKW